MKNPIKINQNNISNTDSIRGTIFGTRKDGELIPLAKDDEAYNLIINPKSVKENYFIAPKIFSKLQYVFKRI